MRHFYQRALGVAVQQQIALAVDHHAAAHFVAPVVVMRNTAQAAFNTAQNNGHVFVRFTAALAVHNGGTVWALTAHVTWGVGIVATDFAISRVAVDHAVHIACGHAPKQIGLAQHLERLCTAPIGLRNNAHPKTLGLQHAPYDRHAKARMVHVGIARDQNNVATIPPQLLHFCTAHRQKRRCAKTFGPVGFVAVQGFGGVATHAGIVLRRKKRVAL